MGNKESLDNVIDYLKTDNEVDVLFLCGECNEFFYAMVKENAYYIISIKCVFVFNK